MEIRHNERGSQRKLGLDRNTKDAIADYCRRRWPVGTAKLAAREWGLSLDEGRGVIAGRASQTTVDKIYKSGGLLLALQVLEAVTGERLSDILTDLRGVHDVNVHALGALVREPWSDGSAGAADRAAGAAGAAGQPAVERRRLG